MQQHIAQVPTSSHTPTTNSLHQALPLTFFAPFSPYPHLLLLCICCCPHSLQVPTVDDPHFWELMDKMVSVNNQLADMSKGTSSIPALLQPFAKLALYERMGSLLCRVLAMKPIDSGSWDYENPAQLQY